MARTRPMFTRKKNSDKKNQPRGGEFGFNKSKELKEILGSSSSSASRSSGQQAIQDRSTIRSTTKLDHDGDEEVYVVSSGSILDEKPKFAKFSQLSSIPAIGGTADAPIIMSSQEDEAEKDADNGGDLGFFFDSTPSEAPTIPSSSSKSTTKSAISDSTPFEYDLPPPVKKKPAITKTETFKYYQKTETKESALAKYQKQKKKIIQDDSVYISSDDDDDDDISDSEDISMLQALSHWGNNDMQLFEGTPTKNNKMTSDDEDYAMLERTALDDIFISSDDEEEERGFRLDEDEQDNILMESDLTFDALDNVPESLKNSYRGMIAQEKSRVKRQTKNHLLFNERRKKLMTNKAPPSSSSRQNKNNLLDQMLHDFIEAKDLETYRLGNLTHHGRTMIVPKIAKLFQLEISEKKKNIVLYKTSKTCIPESYRQHINKLNVKNKRAKTVTATRSAARSIKQRDRRAMREEQLHGQVVASKSEPISSSNIGHRMLAAMGWKTGDAIGNKQDGIKEPIQVQRRAGRRGLGA